MKLLNVTDRFKGPGVHMLPVKCEMDPGIAYYYKTLNILTEMWVEVSTRMFNMNDSRKKGPQVFAYF